MMRLTNYYYTKSLDENITSFLPEVKVLDEILTQFLMM